jgi:hypothetical protein
VAIWHGNDDRVCPPLVGRGLPMSYRGARRYALPKAGHVALYSHWHEGRRLAARDLDRAGRADQLIEARTALLVTHA